MSFLRTRSRANKTPLPPVPVIRCKSGRNLEEFDTATVRLPAPVTPEKKKP